MNTSIVKTNHNEVTKLNKWKLDHQRTGVYKPFITVRQVRKVGRRYWGLCPIQHHHNHLLSDGEYRAYRKLMLDPTCVEVLEQYPLDLDETLNIAIALNLIHPRNYRNNLAYIMTTDFLVTYRPRNNHEFKIAYTFKYFDDIYVEDEHGNIMRQNARTWQKFEIEMQYWQRRNIGYKVITERDATKAESWNYNYFILGIDLSVSHDELKTFCIAFINAWLNAPHAELQCHFSTLSIELAHSFQYIQSLFQLACLRHLLPVNTTKFIRIFRPVELTL